jgi:serine/threonine protein kinase
MNRTVGTLRWQAPELFPDMKSDVAGPKHHNTFATDVYAFALVCFEVS